MRMQLLMQERRKESLVDPGYRPRVHAERVAVDPYFRFPFFLLFFRTDL